MAGAGSVGGTVIREGVRDGGGGNGGVCHVGGGSVGGGSV